MLHQELSVQIAAEQRRDLLAAAEHSRLVAAACGPRLPLSRRVAGPLGRALMRVGAGLLRYGRAGAPTTRPYRASARSIKLN